MQVEAKKEKKKHRIKRAWRSKDKDAHSAGTADDGPKENTTRSSSPPPLENVKDIETGDSVSIGEAGWTPTQRPKIKGKKEKKGSPREGKKKKKRSKDPTEEVLSILLPDSSGPAIAPVEDAVVKKIEKKRKPLDFGKPKRSRALSERVPERSRSSDAHLIAVGSSSEEDSDEESSSSAEEEGEPEVTELDFNNLRKYPKGLLRSFCRSQHIPVEGKRRKQLSKQDYINAILSYTKEEKPRVTRKEKERKEKRSVERATNVPPSRRTRDSPFASPYGNRFLASSQPTYMPSFMPRGMSEEEMLALALEESLKEHAKEEKRKGDSKVDEGKEREKGEKNDEKIVTDVGGEKEKETKTESKKEVPVVLPPVKKETPPPHFMSRSLELKNTPKKKETELDGSQFDSDEAFARALQLQLQREASSESESDDTESDSDDDEIERILDSRGGLLQLLELLAAERGRTLGVLPPYLSNDASLHTGLRIQRSFGPSRYQHQDIDPDKMTYEELLELGEKIGEVKKKGATQSVITGRTQVFKYQPPKVNEERKGNSSCPICMTEFEENDEVRMLPCIHLYHKDCVDKWLQLNATCCVCQRKLTEE